MAIPDPATTEWVPIWNPLSEGPAGPPGDTTPYRDLIEGTYANPAADVARVYALDVNGYTQVEMKDSAGRGVRFSSDNVIIAKITEPGGAARGQAVYIAGAAGANSLVRLAKADAIATMPVIGIVLDAGAVNAFTRVLNVGTLQGVNTSAFVEGVSLFASPTVAGGFTDTLPVAPNYAQRIGFVTRSHATQGEILVLTTGVLADPRLHHATHETGGTDAITALSGGVITTGTVADARLSSNVALQNAGNVFTARQTMQTPGSRLDFKDTTGATDQKNWNIQQSSGIFIVQARTDADGFQSNALAIYRDGHIAAAGGVTERGRSVPMGEWTDVPFNAANFAATAGMVLTVAAGGVNVNAYTLIGKTLVWTLAFSGTLSGTPDAGIVCYFPSSMVAARYTLGNSVWYQGTWTPGLALVNVNATSVTFYKLDISNYALGSVNIAGQITISIP